MNPGATAPSPAVRLAAHAAGAALVGIAFASAATPRQLAVALGPVVLVAVLGWLQARRVTGRREVDPRSSTPSPVALLLGLAWALAAWQLWDLGGRWPQLALWLVPLAHAAVAAWQTRQLRIAVHDLHLRLDTAEASRQAQIRFFAGASHDLRQPLHAMGLFVEALRHRVHDPALRPLVDSAGESVQVLESLFNELLDITRIEAGGVEVHAVPLPMHDVFHRLRLHFEPMAFEKGLQLSFRGGRHTALADPLLVERILRNLVGNAIRYTEDGGVLVGCRRCAGRLRVQVWDSGIGIEAAELPHVFEEFYRARGGPGREPRPREGLGLGLAIVARLARLIGSEIVVQSRPGHGSVFTFELPLGPADAAPGPSAGLVGPSLTLRGRHILVVEADDTVRAGLVALLQSWQATVDDFASAVAWRQRGGASLPAPPDLLIVDPHAAADASVPQLLGELRAAWPSRRLPAIVVSGHALPALDAQAGALDLHVLLKPVPPNRLRALIAAQLASA